MKKMKKRMQFNTEQKKELLKNKNIAKVNENNVKFTSEFKIYAIKQHKLGASSRFIFSEKNIPNWLNKKEYAKKCINRWEKINIRDKGLGFKKESGLQNKGFAGSGKTKPLSDMTLKELMAKIAYLEVENDFLKKAKALETL